jgi:hypothetical protein
MGALSTDRQRSTMTQSAVATDIHQTLDIHLHTLAKIALNLPLRLKDSADAT